MKFVRINLYPLFPSICLKSILTVLPLDILFCRLWPSKFQINASVPNSSQLHNKQIIRSVTNKSKMSNLTFQSPIIQIPVAHAPQKSRTPQPLQAASSNQHQLQTIPQARVIIAFATSRAYTAHLRLTCSPPRQHADQRARRHN